MITALGFHLNPLILREHRQWLAVYLTLVEKWLKLLKVSILTDRPVVVIPQSMVVLQLSLLLNLIRTLD